VLELKNLCVGYGKKEVLHRASILFEPGKLTVLVGPNGCGKSTLLKTALGLLPPLAGEITLDGTSLSHLSRNEIAKRIAFLSQDKRTPDMTVEQLVLHGRYPHLSFPKRYREKDHAIAHAAIERMGLSDLSHAPLSTLSGGMKQNAYIALALTQGTEYILLDEPTTYLDISHQLALMQTLCSLAAEGHGVVCVMHDLPLSLTFADRVAVLGEGRILCCDSPSQVCASGIFERIFGVSVEAYDNGYRYHYPTNFR